MTLLDALSALHELPPNANPADVARLANQFIGGVRTLFFALTNETQISQTGINQDGHGMTRPRSSAADLLHVHLGTDADDGLAPLYDLEPGPLISLRLDAGRPLGALIVDGLHAMPTDEDVRAWRAFAAALAHRIAPAGKLLAAQQRAETDPLTGAATRDVAIATIARSLSEAGQPP